jgi:hypothetical protein
VRRILLILGALAGIALTVFGVALTVDAVGSFSDVRIGETRTPIPGTRDVQLDEGKYVVFYEVSDDSVGSGGEGGFPVPAFEVTVRRAGDGPPLELSEYSTDFNVNTGGRAAQAVATIEVPEDGLYEIGARSDAAAAAPAVVLGKPITGRVLRLIVGVAGIIAGLSLLALVTALAIALATRD